MCLILAMWAAPRWDDTCVWSYLCCEVALSYDCRYFGCRVQPPHAVNSLLGLEAGLRWPLEVSCSAEFSGSVMQGSLQPPLKWIKKKGPCRGRGSGLSVCFQPSNMCSWHVKCVTDFWGKWLLGKNGQGRGSKQGIFLFWLNSQHMCFFNQG